jgi:hypothetical protein
VRMVKLCSLATPTTRFVPGVSCPAHKRMVSRGCLRKKGTKRRSGGDKIGIVREDVISNRILTRKTPGPSQSITTNGLEAGALQVCFMLDE